MGQYSTSDAAKKLGMNARTIRRLCKAEGIGNEVGGVIVLTDGDLDKLRKFKGRKAGNPNWKKGRKTRGNKARK